MGRPAEENDSNQRGNGSAKKKPDTYSHYREILDKPSLSAREIDEMRKNLGNLARTICEHVWGKKVY